MSAGTPEGRWLDGRISSPNEKIASHAHMQTPLGFGMSPTLPPPPNTPSDEFPDSGRMQQQQFELFDRMAAVYRALQSSNNWSQSVMSPMNLLEPQNASMAAAFDRLLFSEPTAASPLGKDFLLSTPQNCLATSVPSNTPFSAETDLERLSKTDARFQNPLTSLLAAAFSLQQHQREDHEDLTPSYTDRQKPVAGLRQNTFSPSLNKSTASLPMRPLSTPNTSIASTSPIQPSTIPHTPTTLPRMTPTPPPPPRCPAPHTIPPPPPPPQTFSPTQRQSSGISPTTAGSLPAHSAAKGGHATLPPPPPLTNGQHTHHTPLPPTSKAPQYPYLLTPPEPTDVYSVDSNTNQFPPGLAGYSPYNGSNITGNKNDAFTSGRGMHLLDMRSRQVRSAGPVLQTCDSMNATLSEFPVGSNKSFTPTRSGNRNRLHTDNYHNSPISSSSPNNPPINVPGGPGRLDKRFPFANRRFTSDDGSVQNWNYLHSLAPADNCHYNTHYNTHSFDDCVGHSCEATAVHGAMPLTSLKCADDLRRLSVNTATSTTSVNSNNNIQNSNIGRTSIPYSDTSTAPSAHHPNNQTNFNSANFGRFGPAAFNTDKESIELFPWIQDQKPAALSPVIKWTADRQYCDDRPKIFLETLAFEGGSKYVQPSSTSYEASCDSDASLTCDPAIIHTLLDETEGSNTSKSLEDATRIDEWINLWNTKRSCATDESNIMSGSGERDNFIHSNDITQKYFGKNFSVEEEQSHNDGTNNFLVSWASKAVHGRATFDAAGQSWDQK